jgi:hydrogenase maturation protease
VKRIVVVGLGDPERAHEAVGIQVVRALGGRIPSDVTVLEDGDPLFMLEKWSQFDVVILVDAVRAGSPAGTVQVFDGRRLPHLVRAGVISMHGYGTRDIIDVGEILGALSKTVRVVGVELPMLDMEPAVQTVLDQVALFGGE